MNLPVNSFNKKNIIFYKFGGQNLNKITKKVLTNTKNDVIILYIFINAMKELRVFGLMFQRADAGCKSVHCRTTVSFRSRTPQPNIRVRSYGSPVTMATDFNKSPNE